MLVVGVAVAVGVSECDGKGDGKAVECDVCCFPFIPGSLHRLCSGMGLANGQTYARPMSCLKKEVPWVARIGGGTSTDQLASAVRCEVKASPGTMQYQPHDVCICVRHTWPAGSDGQRQ